MANKIGIDGIEQSKPQEKLDTSQIQTESSNSTIKNGPPIDVKSIYDAHKESIQNKNSSETSNSTEGLKETKFKKLDDKISGSFDKASNTVDKVNDKVGGLSTRIDNSNLPQFAKNRLNTGLRNSRGRLNKLSNNIGNLKNNYTSKIEKIKKASKVAKLFLTKFGVPILFGIGIIFGLVPLGIAIVSQTGNSPHFYCDLNAPPTIKQTLAYRQYCGSGGGGNDTLVEAALSLVDPCNQSMPQDAAGDKWGDYKKIYDETGTYLTDGHYDNCSGYVSCAIRWALTTNVNTSDPALWLTGAFSNSAEWQEVSESDIQPGDVFISTYGGSSGGSHTFIYVGTEAVHEKFPDAPADHDCVGAGWCVYLPRTNSKEAEKCDKPEINNRSHILPQNRTDTSANKLA